MIDCKHKFLFKVLAFFILMVVTLTPVSAFSLIMTNSESYKKVVHYSELESTHFYADEFSKVSMYYNYRAMMYYELAMLTGNINFLNDSREALETLRFNLEALFRTPICARDLQGIVTEMEQLVDRNINTLDILAEMFKTTDAIDISGMRDLIGEADILNERIVTEVDSLIGPSKIDLMTLSDLSFALHAIQQTLMLAIYSNAADTTTAWALLDKIMVEEKNFKDYFLANLELKVNKTSDLELKKLKSQIGTKFNLIYAEGESLISKIIAYEFPDNKKVDVKTDFIDICVKIDNRFRNEVVGVEFT